MKFISLLPVLILSLCSQSALSQVNLTFAYQDSDNFPYQIGDGAEVKNDHPGVAVEMVQAVSKNLSLDLSLIRLPWKRALLLLEAGEIDGLFNASYKESRLKYGVYPTSKHGLDGSKRSYTNSYSLFVEKSKNLLWDGQGFNQKDIPIFAPRGFSIVDDLKKWGLTVVESSDIPEALDKVNSGLSGGIALLTPSGEAYLRNNPLRYKNIEMNIHPLTSKDYYLMLSHQFVAQNSQLATQIWQGIESFRESDTYKELLEKYYNQRQ